MEYLRTAVQAVAALGGVVSVVLYLLERKDPVKRVEHLVAATLAAAILAAVE